MSNCLFCKHKECRNAQTENHSDCANFSLTVTKKAIEIKSNTKNLYKKRLKECTLYGFFRRSKVKT